MVVAIGSDHAGVELKEHIIALLKTMGLKHMDLGTNSSQSVDYPDFGERVAMAVVNGEAERGILICGTGIGMSIVANKINGIRAALCGDCFSARMSRLHNDANVLVLGGRVIGMALAEDIARAWLETPFDGGRHARRLDKIALIEEKHKPCEP
jgi:ribose 5-phosphate isomerase B